MEKTEYDLAIQLKKRWEYLEKLIGEKQKAIALFESSYAPYMQSTIQIKKHKNRYQYYLKSKMPTLITTGKTADVMVDLKVNSKTDSKADPSVKAKIDPNDVPKTSTDNSLIVSSATILSPPPLTPYSGANVKYLKRKEDKLALAIAQYEYDKKILKAALEEQKTCERYLQQNSPYHLDALYENYTEGRKQLVNPITQEDQEYIKEWESVQYEGARPEEEKPDLYSDKDEQMRSKSEIYIANQLKQYGIPYRYEYPWKVRGLGTVHPDFTILDVKRRREIVWEHFGRMGDEEYVENTLHKLNCYEMNGLMIGDNLIVTYESLTSPLNSRLVKKKIENLILK